MRKFWAGVFACLLLLPLIMIGLMLALTQVPDANIHITWEGFWSAVIVLVGFAFIAALVDGASY